MELQELYEHFEEEKRLFHGYASQVEYLTTMHYIHQYANTQAQILEIGAGCGAITGGLAKKVRSVTCVDLSRRRSLINGTRNRKCDNVRIMVGNFNDIVLEEKFDYITLIGVMEYAAYYTEGKEPFRGFLENINSA